MPAALPSTPPGAQLSSRSDAPRVHTSVDSPIGVLHLVSADGALIGLYLDAPRHLPDPSALGARDDDAVPFALVRTQLTDYFAGELRRFDVPLRMEGTSFQQRVWEALRTIPYGETRTYRELAAAIDSPRAARAVGHALAHNPIAVIIACHRVVGADGGLTGYAGGLERKRRLLDLERGGQRPVPDHQGEHGHQAPPTGQRSGPHR